MLHLIKVIVLILLLMTLIPNTNHVIGKRKMHKIVSINQSDHGSTGKIMLGIARTARLKGYEVITCSPASEKGQQNINNHIYFGSVIEKKISNNIDKLTGNLGGTNFIGTMALIHKIKQFRPDIIHLHNLHGNYINIEMLFQYIYDNDIPVVWTLHDCWNFTGHCAHFDAVKCDKWKTQCFSCPQVHMYPSSFWDCSKKMYLSKKQIFTMPKKIHFIAPSNWLANLVSQSFLGSYPINVIHNGIDLSVFHPREKLQLIHMTDIKNKKIVLAVANIWNQRKGLEYINKLAEELPINYVVIMVGPTKERLSKKIVHINYIFNQNQLADIFSTADVFINPTVEDNYPTVNIEAIACGTPVVTFDTGGCSESIDVKTGLIIEKGNYIALKNAVLKVCEEKPFDAKQICEAGTSFSEERCFQKYVEIYQLYS